MLNEQVAAATRNNRTHVRGIVALSTICAYATRSKGYVLSNICKDHVDEDGNLARNVARTDMSSPRSVLCVLHVLLRPMPSHLIREIR